MWCCCTQKRMLRALLCETVTGARLGERSGARARNGMRPCRMSKSTRATFLPASLSISAMQEVATTDWHARCYARGCNTGARLGARLRARGNGMRPCDMSSSACATCNMPGTRCLPGFQATARDHDDEDVTKSTRLSLRCAFGLSPTRGSAQGPMCAMRLSDINKSKEPVPRG